ncbi:hypothetical protein MTR67_007503 [Solanum verrucosum]|uniref:Uncharacterized protein n=1 Tax=Solanum verrucosum TaxID=315347 RepID=A0AAF0Q0C2_SOLVR|nr:hypothetical protein MTR67_007503 [Solanum verrucosum]
MYIGYHWSVAGFSCQLSSVCKQVKNILSLIFQSEELKMKWLWRYSVEDQLMWKRVVGAKYEAEDSWMTKNMTSPYGVSLWRSIRGRLAEEDALWWKGSNKGIFKVGAAYRLMEQPRQQIPTWW